MGYKLEIFILLGKKINLKEGGEMIEIHNIYPCYLNSRCLSSGSGRGTRTRSSASTLARRSVSQSPGSVSQCAGWSVSHLVLSVSVVDPDPSQIRVVIGPLFRILI